MNNPPDTFEGEIAKSRKKLSTRALQELVRPHAYKAIQRLAELLDSDNPNVVLGASKTLLAKVLPDLRQVDGNIGLTLRRILLDAKDGDDQIQSTEQLPAETTTSIPDIIDPTV